MTDPEEVEGRTDSDADGFDEAASSSRGDPRVLLAMNAVLSTLFAMTVVWGLAFAGILEFTLVNVATAIILLFTVTYAVTMT
ncbi:hypothetical protein [Natronosalvus rutilus]|uniref:DUF8107 domain-containing protein n=1 Tax=Natronosalvus rutilus TaxID=2953753 RepID=A0A9E7NDZ1_9EURY|nr:hypothetical protein [Natronosalvus rutilus]UTF54997.1 hypothetical protein NGM29_07020 [Natronosalvus rutilus]